MATAQSPIFGYCAPYNYFPTAHLPIICLLQINQLFHHWKSPKYMITLHRNIVWLLQIAYLKIFPRFIWLLRKAQFLATAHHTIIFLLRISQLFVYCKSTNYLTTVIRLNIWLLCTEKLYENFKSPIWKYFDDLHGYCAKPTFWLLRNIQLFS